VPFNGAGVYSPNGADFPAVTQTVISSTKYNNVINDIATALSTCLTKDGQQTATANIPFGGFRATNVGITAIAGSVGTPAINVSDAGTGLYRSAASELAVTVAGTQRARFDSTGLIVTGVGTFSGATSTTTLTATVSVVTPLVQAASGAALNLGADGTAKYQIGVGGSLLPVGDNTQNIGSNVARLANVFTPIIDSGTTGSLSLKTNNGVTGFQVDHIALAVNNMAVSGSASGIGTAAIYPSGSDATIAAQYGTKGSGSHGFFTSWGTAVQQFQILHTASSNRFITVTGSNGGNPTIGVTAGSLAITPAVAMAGALSLTGLLSQGTTPALSGNINMPYASLIAGRNLANGADVGLVGFGTTNSIADTVVIGDSSGTSAGVLFKARSGGAAPTTSDLSAGRCCVWRDTGGATTKLYYNNGGVIQSVALA
jgi:hypothetical protein